MQHIAVDKAAVEAEQDTDEHEIEEEEQENFSIAAQQRTEDAKALHDLMATESLESSDFSAAQRKKSAPESKHSQYFWSHLQEILAFAPWNPE